MPNAELTERIKAEAGNCGFQLVGVCPAISPTGFSRFCEWLSSGYAGEMTYLHERQSAYEHPGSVLQGVRSVVMLGMHYGTTRPTPAPPGHGLVSRYAWGEVDYHDLIHSRLKQLKATIACQMPHASVRGVVDTAPLLEREFAQLAGLGWVGKHTLLINKDEGSWFFLAALLLDCELEYDEPFEEDHCGTCRACIDICPTDAIPQAYVLDATRCISYLTIELRSAIPHDLRAGLGDWMFGCDLCQDVCPWNRKASGSLEAGFLPRADSDPIELASLFHLSDEQFRKRFRRVPLWRSKRRGILRNAAIVLGNQRHRPALSALRHGLNDAEPLVRGGCAWALGEMASDDVRLVLQKRLSIEQDETVVAEIQRALQEVC